ncbi:MAG: 16S rRNA (guanine(966)-N(2))-methyltransferase RsmD [Pyrinomonadaceae bacterium]
MRIISGLYRGRLIKSPADNKTRPTSDRLRETIFNILNPFIDNETRFLDLCAGTGAVGIEAISRGAFYVTFVDKSRRACGLIEENLDLLSVPEEQTEVVCLPAESFTGREHPKGWDIVYFDPPYETDQSSVLLDFAISENRLLREGGMLIVEHHSKNRIPDAIGDIRRWRLLKQGETRLSFFERS